MSEYAEHANDFTEEHYRELLGLAARKYRFAAFTDPVGDDSTLLWRHDIDMSPHRARAVARIEAEAGVRATYFVLLHAEMYNALEREVVDIFREIADLGHLIGLHFDPNFYADRPDLEPMLLLERQLLENVLGLPVEAFSWHNPSLGNWIDAVAAAELAGMVNAYGAPVRERFSYLSDSHGVWRFRRLHDVLAAGEEPHLHVLTHPEWWVPEPMQPRARVDRAIQGRAERNQRFYDAAIEAMGRPNVR